MTIRELISKLGQFDQTMQVCVYNEQDGIPDPMSHIEIGKLYWTVEDQPKQTVPYNVIVIK